MAKYACTQCGWMGQKKELIIIVSKNLRATCPTCGSRRLAHEEWAKRIDDKIAALPEAKQAEMWEAAEDPIQDNGVLSDRIREILLGVAMRKMYLDMERAGEEMSNPVGE